MADDPNVPTPGRNEFSAEEEQQMRRAASWRLTDKGRAAMSNVAPQWRLTDKGRPAMDERIAAPGTED